jgi:hypothetical protein
MGDWTIVIHGLGAHHNGKDFDADKMAQDLVYELRRQGHTIKDAKFTYGECTELSGKSFPEHDQTVDILKDIQESINHKH